MRILFVMDPYAGMIPDKDTSFAFMLAAQQRGHECLHCLASDLANEGRHLTALARSIRVNTEAPYTEAGRPSRINVGDMDAVLIRKDPPFDSAYLHLTQQLELVRGQTLVVNDPRALRDANEKLYAFQFAEYMPKTLVSSDSQHLLSFVDSVGGRAVVKPLDGAGGAGVMFLEGGTRSRRGIIDFVTSEGRELAMIQEYQPSVVEGDKRVLLLDGQLLGAIRRVPREDDFRANIHVGGSVVADTLTEKEQALVADVGPQLRDAGLFFVGLDLIAEKLIEVNVTSPTGIQELERLTGGKPSADVIKWLENRVSG